jgi:hypothetical protein
MVMAAVTVDDTFSPRASSSRASAADDHASARYDHVVSLSGYELREKHTSAARGRNNGGGNFDMAAAVCCCRW